MVEQEQLRHYLAVAVSRVFRERGHCCRQYVLQLGNTGAAALRKIGCATASTVELLACRVEQGVHFDREVC